MQCTATKRDGNECRGKAVEAGLCAAHISRMVEARDTRPNGKVAGIPHQYARTYDDFLNDPKPFDMQRELATYRTLYVELRDIIEGRMPHRVRNVAQGIEARVRTRVVGSEVELDALLEINREEIEAALLNSFAIPLTSTEEIMEAGKLLGLVVKAAETMKKMAEGVKLDVTINTELIVRILQIAIFPVIPEPDRRQRILTALNGMALGPVVEHPTLPDVSYMRESVPNLPVPSLSALLAQVPVSGMIDEKGERDPIEVPVWAEV